jgi:Holliday junction resolvase
MERLESDIQRQIAQAMTKSGWLVVKLIQTNWNGIPDLMCIRKGVTIFLEVKRPGRELEPLQEHRIKTLNLIGVHARRVDSIEDISIYLNK